MLKDFEQDRTTLGFWSHFPKAQGFPRPNYPAVTMSDQKIAFQFKPFTAGF